VPWFKNEMVLTLIGVAGLLSGWWVFGGVAHVLYYECMASVDRRKRRSEKQQSA
jgi:hypothetical protein